MLRRRHNTLGNRTAFSDEFGLRRKRKNRAFPCWRMRRGIDGQAMYRGLRSEAGGDPWKDFVCIDGRAGARKKQVLRSAQMTICCYSQRMLLAFLSCSQAPDPKQLVISLRAAPPILILELDRRVSSASTRDVDDLLDRDEHLNVTPRWRSAGRFAIP